MSLLPPPQRMREVAAPPPACAGRPARSRGDPGDCSPPGDSLYLNLITSLRVSTDIFPVGAWPPQVRKFTRLCNPSEQDGDDERDEGFEEEGEAEAELDEPEDAQGGSILLRCTRLLIYFAQEYRLD